MHTLPPAQARLVSSLTQQLSAIRGVRAVVLGGSQATGRALPSSDIDLGLYYSEAVPFALDALRELARRINDTAGPVVSGFYEWGPWVNGGAWLTIGGQRVDFLYRSLEHVERVIVDAEAGRYEVHHLQQPPFGFFSGIYLGELTACVSLFDPESILARLKKRLTDYPGALRQRLVQDYLFMAEFTLTAFAPKFVARADTYGTAACLTRAVNELVLALFALNRRYFLSEKSALAEVAEFAQAPHDFAGRVRATLAHVGTSTDELRAAVVAVEELFREARESAAGLYRPLCALPK